MLDHDDRRAIGLFTDYADAERAVDYLADRGFPVDRVAIIGHDLRVVEQVLGRYGYRQAILRGAPNWMGTASSHGQSEFRGSAS